MAQIKITAVIDIDENHWEIEDSEGFIFFEQMLNDEETFVILHSNDIGDEIGSTSQFTYEIIK
jgi:hypothetical protein